MVKYVITFYLYRIMRYKIQLKKRQEIRKRKERWDNTSHTNTQWGEKNHEKVKEKRLNWIRSR